MSGADSDQLSPQAVDLARAFLNALIVGVRTAVNQEGESALSSAIQGVHEAAEALYYASGGFSVHFHDDAVVINGTKLRFEGGAYAEVVRSTLKKHNFSTLKMHKPPGVGAIKKLISLFNPDTSGPVPSPAQQRTVLPATRDRGVSSVDRTVLAVRTYGMLILACRDQLARARGESEELRPRIHPVRVIAGAIELCRDRFDVLVRMAAHPSGYSTPEIHGANSCILAIALGWTLGLPRSELADIGLAALLHYAAAKPSENGAIGAEDIHASVISMLVHQAPGRAGYLRTLMVAEQLTLARKSSRAKVHVFSQIVGAAVIYDRLVSGFGSASGQAVHPLEALRKMQHDKTGRFDPRVIDLLVNMLRAFPVDSAVMLDSVEHAVVVQLGEAWDRPVVRTVIEPERDIDLREQSNGRFLGAIAATKLYLGDRTNAAPVEAPAETPQSQPQAQAPARAKPLLSRERIGGGETISKIKLPWLDKKKEGEPAAAAPKPMHPRDVGGPRITGVVVEDRLSGEPGIVIQEKREAPKQPPPLPPKPGRDK